MLSKKIVAIGVAILNIIAVSLMTIRLRLVIETMWTHQYESQLLAVSSIVISSLVIIGAIFSLLVLMLMVLFGNYQHTKTVYTITVGVIFLSAVGLIMAV